jgi:TonB family protein
MQGKTPELPVDLPANFTSLDFWWRPRSARVAWILAALFALLFHALLLIPKIPGFFFDAKPLPPPRVDIKQVDPRKLEAIRKQWKAREKQLLIDKSAPAASEPPADARYMSDRNIRVDKEQRAKQTAVIPKAGRPGEPQPAHPPPPPPKAQRRLPELGNLGVKLPAAPRRSPPPRQAAAASNSGDEAGSQAIRDPSLPEGSENLLNAQESVYYSFYSRLYEAIGPVWQSKVRTAARMRRLQPGEYTTHVDVVLDANGNLVGVQQLSSSGIPEFDQAADSAWRRIGRFPNPPTDLLDEKGQIHTGWTFTVQLNQGMNLDYLPPERTY